MSDGDDQELDPLTTIVNDGYYVGAWFLVGRRQDFMAVLYRDAMGTFQLDHRFRYYAPGNSQDPFDGRDRKSAYSTAMPGKTEDEAIAIVDSMVDDMVKDGYCGTRLPWKLPKLRYRIIVRGTGEEFTRALLKQPFVHAKKGGPARVKKGNN